MKTAALTLPGIDEANTAKIAADAFRALASAGRTATMRVRTPGVEEEVEVVLPAEAFQLLVRILSHMATGHAVAVVPIQAELTTQQAAELLGVSRPYLVRLLDEATIPFHRVGTHRRVRAADLIAYKANRRDTSKRLLDALTDEAQELGLGY